MRLQVLQHHVLPQQAVVLGAHRVPAARETDEDGVEAVDPGRPHQLFRAAAVERAHERDGVRDLEGLQMALHGTGEPARAIAALRAAHRRRPADRDVLAALATYLRERGDVRRALLYAEQLATLAPGAPGTRSLVESLRRAAEA